MKIIFSTFTIIIKLERFNGINLRLINPGRKKNLTRLTSFCQATQTKYGH
jgi:hypothetical protein